MAKVCHITSVHKRYDVRIFQKECQSLVQAGYDVSLIVCDELENENCNGVHIKSTGLKPKNRWQRVFKADPMAIRSALQERADIYHFHDPELLRYAKRLHKSGAIVIFDSHEFYAMQFLTKSYIPAFLRNFTKNLYQYFEKKWLRNVDAVVVPCTLDGKNYFEDRAKCSCLVSNAPKLEEFYEFYKEDEKKEDIICQAGSLSYSRGIYHLVKAMEKVPAKLVLAGTFSPKEFQTELEKLDSYSKVSYLGYLTQEEVRNIYRKSKVGLCTLLNEGQYYHTDILSTKICEYMSLGIPVVLFDSPYIKKILKKYSFGIAVNSNNSDEIATAINYLLENQDTSKKMGEIGRQAIKDVFNWENEAKNLIELYKRLLDNKTKYFKTST